MLIGVKLLERVVSQNRGFIGGGHEEIRQSCRVNTFSISIMGYTKGASSISFMHVYRQSFLVDLQWWVASLLIKIGDWVYYSAEEAYSYTFVTSRAQFWVLKNHILRYNVVCDMNYNFDIALDKLRKRIPRLTLAVLLARTSSHVNSIIF
jgi:hypothetical protein